MMTFVRSRTFVRVLSADQAGLSSLRFALLIGLSSSAVLVLVRVGAAAAMTGLGH